jgi:hypothetical protein
MVSVHLLVAAFGLVGALPNTTNTNEAERDFSPEVSCSSESSVPARRIARSKDATVTQQTSRAPEPPSAACGGRRDLPLLAANGGWRVSFKVARRKLHATAATERTVPFTEAAAATSESDTICCRRCILIFPCGIVGIVGIGHGHAALQLLRNKSRSSSLPLNRVTADTALATSYSHAPAVQQRCKQAHSHGRRESHSSQALSQAAQSKNGSVQ